MSPALPEPTADPEVARERVRAYCAAVHTLYGEDNPEPEGLIVDSAGDWDNTDALVAPTLHLLLADLELLVSLAATPGERASYEKAVLEYFTQHAVMRDDLSSAAATPDWIGVLAGALMAARPRFADSALRAQRDVDVALREARAAALEDAADQLHDIESLLDATEELVLDAEDQPFRFTPTERRRIAFAEWLNERAASIRKGEADLV